MWKKLSWLLQRREREDQLSAELEFHLQEEAEERRDAGMPAQDAAWAARRDLGNLGLVREHTRAAWGWTLLEQLLQDLRYGLRNIVRAPAFSALAVLSLALGIGANTAIFSLLDALLMRTLPVPDPSSLVVFKWHMTPDKNTDDSVVHNVSGQIHDGDPKYGTVSSIFPTPVADLLRKRDDLLTSLFFYKPAKKLNVFTQGQAEVTNGEYVSDNFFRGLGVAPAAGRTEEGVVLAYGFAQRRFGDAANAIGQLLVVNNVPLTVAGVAPPGFFGVDPGKTPDLYIPFADELRINPDHPSGSVNPMLDPNYYWTEMMGRLRPGVSIAQAQAALAPAFAVWVASTARNDKERKNLPELLVTEGRGGTDNLRRNYFQPLTILLTMVGLILAIACANIANLLLARATARRREMAVRLSMGAGRWRIIRQMLTESLLLALLGGGVGILCALWASGFLSGLLDAPLHAELNPRVLAGAWLLTVVTGVLFGIAPAVHATHVDPMHALKESRTAGLRSRGFGLGRVLVVAQMAICLLLLFGAGLFVRTLSNLHSLDPGFDRQNLLLFRVNAHQAGHQHPEILSFYRNLQDRLATIPGLRGVTMADSPLIGDGAFGWAIVPVGKPKPEHAPSGHGSGFSRNATRTLATAPGFLSAMHIPLIAGREFNEHDNLVAIVNEAWVKVNCDGQNPIGMHVTSYSEHGKLLEMEVIGLVRNARYDNLTGDFPAVVYLPYVQAGVPVNEMTYFLRTSGNPGQYANAVREIVRQADPRIPVAGLTTQTEQIEGEIGEETLFARLCTAFAALALAIACVGLYGTTSYAVARRTGEIGIRVALGAQRGMVVWMILRDVLSLAAIGLVVSLPLVIVASKLIESILFGIKPSDPSTIAAAVAILFSAAIAAGYVPARRASRIDPIVAVRDE